MPTHAEILRMKAKTGIEGDSFFKPFYFIEVTNSAGFSYYGRGHRCIDIAAGDGAWEIKEFGFRTASAAMRAMNALGAYLNRLNIPWDVMDVAATSVKFTLSDARSLGLLN